MTGLNLAVHPLAIRSMNDGSPGCPCEGMLRTQPAMTGLFDHQEPAMTITPDMQTLANISGTVVLAGAGKMGSALLTGWLARGLDPKRVIVIEPYPSADTRSFAAGGIRLNPAAAEIGATAALVIAVKPQTFGDAASALRPLVGSPTLVVSIMAGTTIAMLDTAC